MKVSALAVLVLLSSVLVGCERGDAPAKSRAASAPGSANAPTIKLLGAGKDPKQALRFAAQNGTKQTAMMAVDMGVTMTVGGSPRTQRIPTITMPMDVAVTNVDKNGDIQYRFELREPQIVADDSTSPAVVDAMKTSLAGIAGLSGTATVTSRGFTTAVDIKAPATANPQVTQFLDSLKQSIGQMSAPLPQEPVGVGATWETRTSVTQNGLKLDQVATTELVAVEGNVITLSIKLTQSAAKQKITANGMTVDLESLSGGGGGESKIDLGQIVPKQAKMSVKSDMKMNSGGQTMQMGFDVAMTMTSQ